MKYRITIDIESSEKLHAVNLQKAKSMAEEAVIEHLKMPENAVIFVNTKLTKESD